MTAGVAPTCATLQPATPLSRASALPRANALLDRRLCVTAFRRFCPCV